MSNKPMLSVERELLATELKADASIGATATELVKGWVAMVELRALLDEPDEPFSPQGWSIDHSAGRPILMHNKCSVIEAEQAYGLLNLIETADQPRVDPVAEVYRGPVSGINRIRWVNSRTQPVGAKLYAEQPAPVALTVWYGSMPESNGKTNWTAILHRKGEAIWSGAVITIDRSEYPDRVRYEADRMRYLIGELTEEPDILDYDDKLHSGYVNPHKPAPVADHTQCEECKGWGYHENHHEGGGTECGECGGSGNAPVAVVMPDVDELAQIIRNVDGSHTLGAGSLAEAILEEVARLNGVKP